MHTPEQAREMWCPMVKMARVQALAIDFKDDHNCLADKCAMWRWDTYIAPPAGAEPGKLVQGVQHRAGTGHCGLAPLGGAH